MKTADYDKASGRFQAFSKIFKTHINMSNKLLYGFPPINPNFSSSYIGWMRYNVLINKIQDALYKAIGL